MDKRSQQEIEHMIRALEHEKLTARNQRELIDRQISILKGDEWDEDAEAEDWDDIDASTLMLCQDWLDGHDCEAPASEEALEATKEY